MAGLVVDPGQLRLAVIPRKAIPDLKKQGLSNRKIAKLTGVSDGTVRNDLATQNYAKSAQDCASVAKPTAPIPPGEFETIVIDPPWPMTKIVGAHQQVSSGSRRNRRSAATSGATGCARGGNGGASGYGASAAAESRAKYAVNVRTSI